LQQHPESLLRQPNTTASAMPCYDTRLRLIPRHPSAVLHSRCPSTMPVRYLPAIPRYDMLLRQLFRTPPRHYFPGPSTTSPEMPIATTRATLYTTATTTTTTNALCPCTLILLLPSGQVRQIMQVLQLPRFHATLRPMPVLPSRPSEPALPWSGVLVHPFLLFENVQDLTVACI
jgi:hypothetical protein